MKKNLLFLSLSLICLNSKAMELDQSKEQSSMQTDIQSLISKKRIADAVYGALVVGTTVATICNTVWEEPTLHSDYFGADALSVGNKLNTVMTIGFSVADMLWLLKPYYEFSHDESKDDNRWSVGMMITHGASGIIRSSVGTILGVCAGIRRYPRTLTMIVLNGLVDFAGSKNAEHHMTIDDEIEKLKNKSE